MVLAGKGADCFTFFQIPDLDHLVCGAVPTTERWRKMGREGRETTSLGGKPRNCPSHKLGNNAHPPGSKMGTIRTDGHSQHP